MADADFSVKAIISAQTSQFEKGMKNAQSSVNSMSKSIEGVQKLLSTAFSVVGITASIKSVVDFGKKCVQSANEAQKAFKILDNTVKVTGADAWTSTEEMEGMAKSLSDVTNYSVSEIEDMQSVLLGFKNITGDTFKEASNAIMDMATVMKMDLGSAVQTVGKALDDPIKGLDSLRRQGFAFTDEQKVELEQLIKTGHQLEAQKIILEELSTTYGGAAQAAQSSFAKQKNAATELYETVGDKLLPITEYFAESNTKTFKNLTAVIEKINFDKVAATFEFLSEAIQEVVKTIWNDLTELFDSLEEVFGDGENLVDAFVNNFWRNFNSLYQTFQDVIHFIKSLIEGDWSVAWDYAKLIVLRMTKNVIQNLTELVNKNLSLFNILISGYNKILEGQDKVLVDFLHLPEKYFKSAKIPKLNAGDLIDLSDIDNMISEIEKSIEQATGKAADYELKSLSEISALVEKYIKKRTKQTLDLGNTQEKVIKNTNSVTKGIMKGLMKLSGEYSEIIDKNKQWDKLLENVASNTVVIVGESFKTFFTTLGEELAQGSVSWQSMTAIVLESIAETLSALGSQLVALAAVAASQERYHDAAVAAAGAAAAFVASGTISAIASQMKEAANEAANIVSSISELQQKLNEIKSEASFDSMYSDLTKLTTLLGEANEKVLWAQMQYDITYALTHSLAGAFMANPAKALLEKDLKALNSAKASVKLIEDSIRSYYESVRENLEAVNAEIQNQIKYYTDLYTVTDDLLNVQSEFLGSSATWGTFELESSFQKYKIMIQQQTNSIKESILSVFNEFSTIGTTIGENIVDGIIDGTTKQDFASQLKSYLRENMIKLAVYTDEFSEKLGQSSTNFIIAMNTKNADLLATTRRELEKLWDGAKSAASEAESFIDSVFGDIRENVESVIESAEEMGSSIADSLIDGLSNGLSQADFLETMKSYIKKLVVTSVVYTESLQAEIAAIGEAISNGIKEGFSETGLDEIRRDLSYIWYNANNAVSAIDSILDNVFTGYATGTDNATTGLHLVGEAGPELVRFRGGEQVYNANETRDILSSGNGGNNFNVTFNNMQDTSAFTMLQQMKQWQRDMAINGVI